MRIRRTVQEAMGRLFGEVDLVLSPARYSLAPAVREPLDRASGTAGSAQGRGTRAIVSAGNLAGLPALVLPCGLAADGSAKLPVAVLLTGRPFSENTLLRMGIEFQDSTDWRRQRPVV
jgi:aspartyl-tRNA(Asn)/glutamyl-tRNA(Gln) amidotransferase subunit A